MMRLESVHSSYRGTGCVGRIVGGRAEHEEVCLLRRLFVYVRLFCSEIEDGIRIDERTVSRVVCVWLKVLAHLDLHIVTKSDHSSRT